jgi:hypothetical protein
LLRWYWWRVTAWCEIVAMISSFAISVMFLVLKKNGAGVADPWPLLITVAFTSVCWLATAYLGPRNDESTLIEFYRKVRPFGPGWTRIRLKAGIPADEMALDARAANFSLALMGWFAGCIMIWSALFTVGNFLYGRMGYTAALAIVFVVSGVVVIRTVRRLWV